MTAITKDVLRALSAHRGEIDRDCGQVFTGFAGALDTSDGLYHGELRYADPDADGEYTQFSMSSVLSGTGVPRHIALTEPIEIEEPTDGDPDKTLAD